MYLGKAKIAVPANLTGWILKAISGFPLGPFLIGFSTLTTNIHEVITSFLNIGMLWRSCDVGKLHSENPSDIFHINFHRFLWFLLLG